MIIFHFLLFIPILVSAVDPFIKGRTLARREDTYDIAQDGVLFGTDYINADHIDDNAESNELDYALFLDGTSNPGDSNLVGSGCSSSQRTSKLRSREQCDNPSAPKPEIPSIDTVGSAAIELKRRCDEGEERLCCAGDAIHFWGGFRAIVPNCAKYLYGCYYPGEEWCCGAFIEGIGLGRFALPYGIGCVQIPF